jgi:hypothetical protein
MKRGSATYTSRRRYRLAFPRAISLPWATYECNAYLFWRIRILLWLPLLAAGWFVLRGYGLLVGAAVAVLVEARTSYRKRDGPRAAPVAVRNDTRRTARAASPWETSATPSPGGWQPPRHRLPAWDWAPPSGLRPRLDRVPQWVRVWYHTPFIDRYAHAWMWRHGGWDVLPPSPPAGS